MFALLINASILILAAATFYKTGRVDVSDLGDAPCHARPLLGRSWRQALRDRAIVLRPQFDGHRHHGGQIVMEGFLDLRIPAWMRRLRHRMVAIIPAARGDDLLRPERHGALLILSQVVLAFQLPFAIVPLVMFTRDRARWARSSRPCGSRSSPPSSPSSSSSSM